MNNSPEQTKHQNQEQNIENVNLNERLEKPIQNPEKTAELSERDVEARAEKARIEALKNASNKESDIEKGNHTKSLKKSRSGVINNKELDKSFKQTMKNIQSELPPAKRAFSKIIHNKVVEKTSDILGNTIARPNAILAGAFFAFILTLITYIVAQKMGYSLSGSETIFSFIIGWMIGIIYDYLRLLFTGKNS